jgi:predicted enzyme related to lactoylglutathione lyase
MTRIYEYPVGVPCFVDSVTDDMVAAQRFYGGVFGWEFVGPGETPGDPPGEHFVARMSGLDVAGLGRLGGGVTAPPSGWSTHVAVADVDDAADRARDGGATIVQEPFDAAPAGRMAIIADPAGALLCLWEPGERQGAQLVNTPSAWAMSLLSTPDPDGARDFYGRLFGWQAETFDAGDASVAVSLWRLPGYVGGEPEQPVPRDVVAAMMTVEAGGAGTASWGVDFWIADAERAAEAASGLGGSVLVAPHDAPPFRRVVLAAPDGAAFSVSELRLPG